MSILLLALFAFYTYKIVKFLNYTLNIKLAFLKYCDENLDEKCKPFEIIRINMKYIFVLYFFFL